MLSTMRWCSAKIAASNVSTTFSVALATNAAADKPAAKPSTEERQKAMHSGRDSQALVRVWND